MEAIAEHDFVPDGPGELGFKKGDKLYISNYGEQVLWYNAHKDGKAGLVPGNYIQITREKWYKGRIQRSFAETLLGSNQKVGAFLVRLSESSPTDFSLSVKCFQNVEHFRINREPDFRYFLWEKGFPSINELIEYYRHVSVSNKQQILLCDMDDEKFIAEALYSFEPAEGADGETELGFREGERIIVYDSHDHNWWAGRIGDREGFFPMSYVKRIPDSSFKDPN